MALVGALLMAAAACGGSKPTAAPPPTAPAETTTPTTTATTKPAPATTVRPTSTSSTARPTTTATTLLGLGPGNASIGGTVSGPAGPVDGATVRVERIVGKAVATTDVVTAGGGSWNLGSVLGGSYRVRAFKAPDLGPSPVEAFFLGANDRKTFDLKMPGGGGERLTAVVNPNPPRVDQPATVTVQVGIGRVDDQGRPLVTPRPGVILVLSPAAGILLESAPQAVTDGNGSATWAIRCAAEGADTISLTVGAGITSFKLPACGPPVPPPATTTTKAR